jgi:hypothetical protein
MALEGSPLIAWAQQGVEATNQVIAAKRSARNHRGEPSAGNQYNGQVKRTQSEVASSANGNRHLTNNDSRLWITQNCWMREYGRDRDDLRNIIDDRRHLRGRSLTPSQCSPVRDATPLGRGGFCALASHLR